MAKKNVFSKDIKDDELLKQTLIFLIDCIYDIRRDDHSYCDELKLKELQERLKEMKYGN